MESDSPRRNVEGPGGTTVDKTTIPLTGILSVKRTRVRGMAGVAHYACFGKGSVAERRNSRRLAAIRQGLPADTEAIHGMAPCRVTGSTVVHRAAAVAGTETRGGAVGTGTWRDIAGLLRPIAPVTEVVIGRAVGRRAVVGRHVGAVLAEITAYHFRPGGGSDEQGDGDEAQFGEGVHGVDLLSWRFRRAGGFCPRFGSLTRTAYTTAIAGRVGHLTTFFSRRQDQRRTPDRARKPEVCQPLAGG